MACFQLLLTNCHFLNTGHQIVYSNKLNYVLPLLLAFVRLGQRLFSKELLSFDLLIVFFVFNDGKIHYWMLIPICFLLELSLSVIGVDILTRESESSPDTVDIAYKTTISPPTLGPYNNKERNIVTHQNIILKGQSNYRQIAIFFLENMIFLWYLLVPKTTKRETLSHTKMSSLRANLITDKLQYFFLMKSVTKWMTLNWFNSNVISFFILFVYSFFFQFSYLREAKYHE